MSVGQFMYIPDQDKWIMYLIVPVGSDTQELINTPSIRTSLA